MGMSVLILAGGKSTRMKGNDKANFKYRGYTFLEGIYHNMKSCTNQILISEGRLTKRVYNEEIQHAEFVRDIYEDRGPLGGVYAGLIASDDEYVFVVACDMPNIKFKFANYLLTFDEEQYDAIIPSTGEQIEPLAGIYKKRILHEVKMQLDAGENDMKHLLSKLKVRLVDIGNEREYMNMLINVNTHDDYQQLLDKVL